MSSKSQSKNEDQHVPPSNNSIYGPYGGWTGFMHSYGLKPWDNDDVEEAKAILAEMKKMDRLDWEEAQKNKNSK
ncbi:hypothetical protein FA15DRAFT_671486 [Coprinopsis marcescibilis]|uniref:Uncharacterized protein n=1 Tax=Coprinopsis marcescibilis TaxID=230819 RepID=A0A5C3KPY5_COPMA|nr:hypothetical protein FA15DRAFT_671486 [Coprinopsis marcescibilis]